MEHGSKTSVSLCTVTLNCGEFLPDETDTASLAASMRYNDTIETLQQLFKNGVEGADVIAVCLQEMCPLTYAIDLTDMTTAHHRAAWSTAVTKALKSVRDYNCLAEVHLVGLFLLVFCKADLRHDFTDLRVGSIRCGTLGIAGNKGAVAAGFSYQATSICIVNAHLHAHASGEGARERAHDVRRITEELLLEAADGKLYHHGGRHMFDYDVAVLAGDTNSRLFEDSTLEKPMACEKAVAQSVPLSSSRILHIQGAQCSGEINNNQCRYFMQSHDEICVRRSMPGEVLAMFDEAPITFSPTYKLCRGKGKDGQDVYDMQRPPAWCDRVLWRASPSSLVTTGLYECIRDVAFSDHRPVRLMLQITVVDSKSGGSKEERMSLIGNEATPCRATRAAVKDEEVKRVKLNGQSATCNDQAACVQCPLGHRMESFDSPFADFECDRCHRRVEKGIVMHRCWNCHFDACPDCCETGSLASPQASFFSRGQGDAPLVKERGMPPVKKSQVQLKDPREGQAKASQKSEYNPPLSARSASTHVSQAGCECSTSAMLLQCFGRRHRA